MAVFPMVREEIPPVHFVPHPLFLRPDARLQIEQLKPQGFENDSPSKPPATWDSKKSPLGRLCAQPVLSRAEERYLFLRMNYEKFVAQSCEGHPRKRRLSEANVFRDRILLANLRLLVSIAGHFASRTVRTEELVSEGMVPLHKAIELFDVSRGWAFGTYATHVLRNHFRRQGKRHQKDRLWADGSGEGHLSEVLEQRFSAESQAELAHRQDDLARECLRLLSETDRIILRTRFGFDEPAGSKLKSYADVGEAVGLSKERVRVRAHRAIEQLRATALERQWEFPELETLNL